MRSQIVIGIKHGAKVGTVICGPEVPIDQQIKKVKALKSSRVSAEYSEVSVYERANYYRFAQAKAEPQKPSKK